MIEPCFEYLWLMFLSYHTHPPQNPKFKWLQLDWIHNQLVRKQTLNHLAKLAKWLSCFVSTYMYSAFDSMFLLCYIWVLEWIDTLLLAESQGTPSFKQAWNLKFKWLQLDWIHNQLVQEHHLPKLVYWLSFVMVTYLCRAFHCMWPSHICISEWIHTL